MLCLSTLLGSVSKHLPEHTHCVSESYNPHNGHRENLNLIHSSCFLHELRRSLLYNAISKEPAIVMVEET
jgi:hypothetical protein